MVEQRSPKPQVAGSNPSWPVKVCMKNYLKINETAFFITSIIIIFTLINYLAINKNIMLLLTTCICIATIISFLLTIKKSQTLLFFKDIKSEIKNIYWPKKKEINQTLLMVVIITLLTSITLWIIDSILTRIITKMI